MVEPHGHDCSNYPVTTCRWCEKSWLVARWWPGVYDNFHDPIPLAKLPVEILAAFLDYFESIVETLSAKALTEKDRREVADLYDVARLFIGELERREDTYQLERACGPGWRAAC